MFGTLALAAGVLFLVLAIARLRRSPLKVLAAGVPLAAALAAVFALLHWHGTGDTRWMVGAVLLAAALGLSLGRGNRTLAIVAVICGVLGTALFGIATAKPMAVPTSALTAA